MAAAHAGSSAHSDTGTRFTKNQEDVHTKAWEAFTKSCNEHRRKAHTKSPVLIFTNSVSVKNVKLSHNRNSDCSLWNKQTWKQLKHKYEKNKTLNHLQVVSCSQWQQCTPVSGAANGRMWKNEGQAQRKVCKSKFLCSHTAYKITLLSNHLLHTSSFSNHKPTHKFWKTTNSHYPALNPLNRTVWGGTQNNALATVCLAQTQTYHHLFPGPDLQNMK